MPAKVHECIEGSHVVNIFSFSKAYGLMGWRVGFLTYPPALNSSLVKVVETNLSFFAAWKSSLHTTINVVLFCWLVCVRTTKHHCLLLLLLPLLTGIVCRAGP